MVNNYCHKGIILLMVIFSLFFISSKTVQAAEKWVPPNLQISIPTIKNFSEPTQCDTKNGQPVYCVPWIGEYISGVYKYAIGIVGIVAAIALMIGGVRWLTAGGNPSSVKDAQSWISGAVTGLIIALASYFILYQINPNLIEFRPLKILMVKEAPVLTGGSDKSRITKCTIAIGRDSAKDSMGYIHTTGRDCVRLEPNTCEDYKDEAQKDNCYKALQCYCEEAPLSSCSWSSTACGGTKVASSSYNSCGTNTGNYSTCCCEKGPAINCNNCASATQGACNPDALRQYFGANSSQASAICNTESTNCNRKCNPPNCNSSNTWSAGCFQINYVNCGKKYGMVNLSADKAACHEQLMDNRTNFLVAGELFKKNGWKDWSVYTSNDPVIGKCKGCF